MYNCICICASHKQFEFIVLLCESKNTPHSRRSNLCKNFYKYLDIIFYTLTKSYKYMLYVYRYDKHD